MESRLKDKLRFHINGTLDIGSPAFPSWEYAVPNLGMRCSQAGNTPFPTWEHLS